MCKQRKNPIERKKVDPVYLSGEETSRPITEKDKVDLSKYEPKIKKRKPMLKRLFGSKVIKGIVSTIGGALGFGGSILGGLDPEYAFVVGVTAVIVLFGGIEKARKFYDIVDDDFKKDSK